MICNDTRLLIGGLSSPLRVSRVHVYPLCVLTSGGIGEAVTRVTRRSSAGQRRTEPSPRRSTARRIDDEQAVIDQGDEDSIGYTCCVCVGWKWNGSQVQRVRLHEAEMCTRRGGRGACWEVCKAVVFFRINTAGKPPNKTSSPLPSSLPPRIKEHGVFKKKLKSIHAPQRSGVV